MTVTAGGRTLQELDQSEEDGERRNARLDDYTLQKTIQLGGWENIEPDQEKLVYQINSREVELPRSRDLFRFDEAADFEDPGWGLELKRIYEKILIKKRELVK